MLLGFVLQSLDWISKPVASCSTSKMHRKRLKGTQHSTLKAPVDSTMIALSAVLVTYITRS